MITGVALIFHEDGRIEVSDGSEPGQPGAPVPTALIKAFSLQRWIHSNPAAFAYVLEEGQNELLRRAGRVVPERRTDAEIKNLLQATILAFVNRHGPQEPEGISADLQSTFDSTLRAAGFDMELFDGSGDGAPPGKTGEA